MELLQGSLYDYPSYYDLVFGSDWKAEHDFLQQCFQRFAKIEVKRVFEPACGTGRLLFRLARGGYEVSGLDLNERAVAYCNDRLVRRGFPPSAFVGDMTDFRLRRRVDACFNMINSFRHLQSEAAARNHLRRVSAALKRGGIYVLGLHLTPTAVDPMEDESWSARRGNLMVNTQLQMTYRDLPAREEHFEMTCEVYTPTKRRRVVDEVVFRTYTADEISDLLGRVPDLQLLATYDFAYDLTQPALLDERAEDIVLVLGKT